MFFRIIDSIFLKMQHLYPHIFLCLYTLDDMDAVVISFMVFMYKVTAPYQHQRAQDFSLCPSVTSDLIFILVPAFLLTPDL